MKVPYVKVLDETRVLTCGDAISIPMTPKMSMKSCGKVRSRHWRRLNLFEKGILKIGIKPKNLEYLDETAEEEE